MGYNSEYLPLLLLANQNRYANEVLNILSKYGYTYKCIHFIPHSFNDVPHHNANILDRLSKNREEEEENEQH